ncbi:hypothetical protein [Pseudaestuariivita atlantica]|uniref:Uncharacterized protein n=1 Tax=Pseudaestuariivita atlantica TaxID=1317121 RepID=A0A0L1JJS2_9RHOB|nr:hypothetical protein [Pseudaestuariivita atlantica]KNG91990.1 hypothetical protein ATO11_19815 [Pseudaestuariivita atlantica]
MKPVFAIGLILAATTAGAAPAKFGPHAAAQDVLAYAPDASAVLNPDADHTLSGVGSSTTKDTPPVLPRFILTTSG